MKPAKGDAASHGSLPLRRHRGERGRFVAEPAPLSGALQDPVEALLAELQAAVKDFESVHGPDAVDVEVDAYVKLGRWLSDRSEEEPA